jgi:SAM-dependent methyltransferase
VKGWFEIPGVQTGDRTLEEQLTGLPVDELAFGDILDVGCAEGLISKHLLERGAKSAVCLDNNTNLVEIARRMLRDHDATVIQCDLNDVPALDVRIRGLRYDVALLLSILQKLEKPADVLHLLLRRLPKIIAIRLPTGPIVVNKFTKQIMCDVREELTDYTLDERPGPRGEWVGIFRRRA